MNKGAFLGSSDLIVLDNSGEQSAGNKDINDFFLENITFSSEANLSFPTASVQTNKNEISELFNKGTKEDEDSFFKSTTDGLLSILGGAVDFSTGVVSEVGKLADSSEDIIKLLTAVKDAQGLFQDEEDAKNELDGAVSNGQLQQLLQFQAQQINQMTAQQRARLDNLLGTNPSDDSKQGFQLTTPMVVGGLGLVAILGMALVRR